VFLEPVADAKRTTALVAAPPSPLPVELPSCLSTRPANRQLGDKQIALLLERGREFMSNGNFAPARALFQRAAEACNQEASVRPCPEL
jgi:hypothetical protein